MPMRRTARSLLIQIRTQRRQIIRRLSLVKRREVARALREVCYEAWSSEPIETRLAATALADLAALTPDPEIDALAAWASGIALITRGRLESAKLKLEHAEAVFRQQHKRHEAATVSVARVMVLAMLGDYRSALTTGRAALRVFEECGDELAAGKVEKNIGNIIVRQDGMKPAEKYYRSALRRFAAVGDRRELVMCETNLAENFADLDSFVEAEHHYTNALKEARDANLTFVEAEIEASLGNLARLRGRFADALRLLEQSRRRFDELGVKHRAVVASLEIAEIYAGLNLTSEAREIYGETAVQLRRLGMRAEEAGARSGLGLVSVVLGDYRRAARELSRAAELFLAERNRSGLANVRLTQAKLEYERGRFVDALTLVGEAEKLLRRIDDPRRRLAATTLRGDIYFAQDRLVLAERHFRDALATAERNDQPALVQTLLTRLGRTAVRRRRDDDAKKFFERSIELVETLRAPLPGDEFRISFLAAQTAPFEELAKLLLDGGEIGRALRVVEQGRARSLADVLSGELALATDQADPETIASLDLLREELSWFQQRQLRAAPDEQAALLREVKKREKSISDLARRRASLGTASNQTRRTSFSFEGLQAALGSSALVEFVSFGESLGAFVVTEKSVGFQPLSATTRDVLELISGLRFQFGALRVAAAAQGAFGAELRRRADVYLAKLQQLLIAPLEPWTGSRDLVIIPDGVLHYVPFHALRAADGYLTENRLVSVTPSAEIWRTLNQRPWMTPRSALLVGYADEKIPLVDREIENLRRVIGDTQVLTGANATLASFHGAAVGRELLHLACHGRFRSDNPMFSSLRLADGNISVGDICERRLTARLVTLSACESGLSQILPGGEIIGLARGFLAAGAESVVLSLWNVNDASTTRLMTEFYGGLMNGLAPTASLQQAQRSFIEEQQHPYFWAPFTIIGR